MFEDSNRPQRARDLSNRIQYRTEEVAEVAGVSVSEVKVWIKTGALLSYSIGRMRFVHIDDLNKFINGHRLPSLGLAS